jgi:hypothetical protein
MHDNSNNQATGTVDLCVIGVSGSPGFDYGMWQGSAPGPASPALQSEVAAATVLLSGFDLNYGPDVDHHVLIAQAGPQTGSSLTISSGGGRSTVTTSTLGFISDDSQHSAMGPDGRLVHRPVNDCLCIGCGRSRMDVSWPAPPPGFGASSP